MSLAQDQCNASDKTRTPGFHPCTAAANGRWLNSSAMSTKPIDDPSYPVHKSDAEWREQLDPMQYQVARHAATERAFTGKYWDHFEPGRYDCVGCGTPLFRSDSKFDAGCGWPSYAEPINADVIEYLRDTPTAWCASKCAAASAARTWAMCSTTARHRPASAIASTRPR